MPEDFDFEAWIDECENFHADPPFSKKLKHFISYLPFFIKYRVLHIRSASENQIYDEDEDDEEFSIMFGRGIEILAEIRIQILEFAEQLMDKDRAEIEYRNKRIVYYRKDHLTNSGFAHYIEDLEGSNRFEYGWAHESGTRQQIIESISLHVGFECARVEMGSL